MDADFVYIGNNPVHDKALGVLWQLISSISFPATHSQIESELFQYTRSICPELSNLNAGEVQGDKGSPGFNFPVSLISLREVDGIPVLHAILTSFFTYYSRESFRIIRYPANISSATKISPSRMLAMLLDWGCTNATPNIAHILAHNGVDLDIIDDNHMTALHWAVCGSRGATIKALIAAGASQTIKHDDSTTILAFAVTLGLTESVQALVDAGANINTPSSFGMTPLLLATFHGNVECMRLLIAAGADIHAVNSDSHGALTLAACVSYEIRARPCVEVLLRAGCDATDYRDRDGGPLTMAARWGYTAVVELLLAARANVDSPDMYGATPLHAASSHGYIETVTLLLAAGANVNAVNERKETALICAGMFPKLVDLLLHAKTDINKQDWHGRSALILSIVNPRKQQSIPALLAAKASLELVDNKGYTPLTWAAITNSPGIIRMLLDAGAVVDARDKAQRRTPLMHAAEGGGVDAVEMLLAAGAAIDAMSRERATALMLAASTGQTEVVRILLNAMRR